MRRLLKDLFYGPGNHYLDLGRLLAFFATVALFAAVGWNVHLGQPIDLGPAGLGGGLAGILTAAAGFLAAKAWERRQVAKSEREAEIVHTVTGEDSK